MIQVITSGFGLSVATGIALEALFIPTLPRIDETLQIKRIELSTGTRIYISLHTLVRNWFSALEDKAERTRLFKSSNISKVYAAIKNELDILSGLSEDNEIIVYVTVYKRNDKLCPAKKERPTIADMVNAISDKLASRLDTVYYKPLDEKFGDAIVLTHSSLDLVYTENDRKVRLLESHTGRILRVKEFGKKLRKSSLDTSRLPLCRSTILIFGDSAGLLNIPKPKCKKVALDELIRNNVTPLDKDSKIRSILKNTLCAEYL